VPSLRLHRDPRRPTPPHDIAVKVSTAGGTLRDRRPSSAVVLEGRV
jgi:hypothetical protein